MLRKAALFAFITAVASLIIFAWRVIQDTGGKATSPSAWISVAVVTVLPAIVMPVFHIALYRSSGLVHLSPRLKRMSRGAAFVAGLLFIQGLVRSLPDKFGAEMSLEHVLAVLTYLASAFLLLALSRLPGEQAEDVPPSRFFRRATRIAVKVQCMLIAFALVLFGSWLIYPWVSNAAQTK